MRILGIDPGYAIVGYGIIDYNCGKFSVVAYGAITTPSDMPFEQRLLSISNDMEFLINKYKPTDMAIEKLYFNTNTTTAIDVAQARGVILLSAKKGGLNLNEYTPLQVKQSVTGYGRAEKHQVMEMTKSLLNLKSVPKPDDTADALAVAVCHAHYSGSAFSKLCLEVTTK
ncbi:MAG: crossover junction endodeoxyribonuclease RuvC [Clostridia bacterium]|nr:crossover junction endodeoxyribonuclease RuvC [Clostridia bacterium]